MTLTFQGEEQKQLAIRRLKYWAVEGMSIHGRSGHEKRRATIKRLAPADVPSMSHLDELQPDADRPLTESDDEERKPTKRARGTKRRIAAPVVPAASATLGASDSSSSPASSQQSESDSQ